MLMWISSLLALTACEKKTKPRYKLTHHGTQRKIKTYKGCSHKKLTYDNILASIPRDKGVINGGRYKNIEDLKFLILDIGK